MSANNGTPRRNGKGQHKPPPLGDVESARLAVDVATTRQAPPSEVASQLTPDWGDGLLLAEDQGEDGLAAWLKTMGKRYRDEPDRVERYGRAIAEARTGTAGQGSISPPAERPPYRLKVMGSAALSGQEFRRDWLVKGILVRGQPCIVGGPRKGLKTSLMVDLVISLAAASRFLGEFTVTRPVKVLFLSGESGDATIQETARRVCRAKGIELDELEGLAFWSFELPQLSSPEQLKALADFIRENGIEVVVVDPLYLCLLGGGARIDPANLFDVGPLLKMITEVCLEAGATPLLVHHLRKNRDDHNAPPELEDLAYSGVQEFARQWIMTGRRETYEPGSGEHRLWLSVGGSAGHSGAWSLDISEGVIGDDFSGRRWDVQVIKATEARRQTREQADAAKAEQIAARHRLVDEQRQREIGEDAEGVLAKLRTMQRATKGQLRDAFRWNATRTGAALARLTEGGQIRPVDVLVRSGKGQRTESGFEPSDVPLEGPLFRCRTLPDVAGQDQECPATALLPDGVPGQEGALPLKGEPLRLSGNDVQGQGDPSEGKKARSRTRKSPGMNRPKGKGGRR